MWRCRSCIIFRVIPGHNHNFQVSDLYGTGMMFYQGDNIAKRSFMIFTITDDGYEMEKVEF